MSCITYAPAELTGSVFRHSDEMGGALTCKAVLKGGLRGLYLQPTPEISKFKWGEEFFFDS